MVSALFNEALTRASSHHEVSVLSSISHRKVGWNAWDPGRQLAKVSQLGLSRHFQVRVESHHPYSTAPALVSLL